MANQKSSLKRHITLWPLVLYGMGDILGAGVYGLIGKAAGQMGNAVWMAFLMSMIAAGFTGLSYASLGSRYPRAGGASYITLKAYKSNFVAYVVGLAVLASGLTSMATASRVFAGYFTGVFPQLPSALVIVVFALVLAAIIFIGIRETLWVNSLLTVVELSGLVIIIVVGFSFLGEVNYLDAKTAANLNGDLTLSLLLGGAVLTFYSFIGFEDILNVSEEVKDPERTLPWGLLLALGFASVIYILISLVSVSVVPAGELAQSKEPLVDVLTKAAPWFPSPIYSLIALLAVSNTALLNFVMGSRLLYGMATQGLMPKKLSEVHSKRATPHVAVLVILVILLILSLSGNIESLAKSTSVLLLASFAAVNLALLILQKKDKTKGRFEVPAFVPMAGFGICLAMLSQANKNEASIAGAIVVAIMILYFVLKPKLGTNVEAFETTNQSENNP